MDVLLGWFGQNGFLHNYLASGSFVRTSKKSFYVVVLHIAFARTSGTVVCLTADGFNQLQSGGSSLSSLFDGISFALGVVDEGHQITSASADTIY